MEKNTYGFNFDPNKTVTEKTFTDNNGKSNVSFQGDGAPLGGNLGKEGYENDHYVIANKPKTKTKSMKNNIGPGSNGFAGVATLAIIIAVAGVIVAFLTLRY